METEAEVLVIGGGVIGVCSAYYLAQRGIKTTLIEKGEIASGCSYGNGGLIVPSDAVPLASPDSLGNGLRWLLNDTSPFYIKPRLEWDLIKWLLRFVRASRKPNMLRALPTLRDLLIASRNLYEELARSAGFDFGFEGHGSLHVFLSEENLQTNIADAHWMERFNIPFEVWDADQIHDCEPALTPKVIGGVYHPTDGHIDPSRFVTRLAEKAQELGARIYTQTEVLQFEISQRQIVKIHTTRGVIQPKQVVLAAGAWSPQVVRGLKLKIPIQPAKGYSVTLENPSVPPKYPLFLAEGHTVVNPLRHALRVAGTLELAGMDFSYNARRVEVVHNSMRGYLNGVEDLKVIEIWRGLRPCTPDGLPVISRVAEPENLVVAAGHAMLGMSLGPITGKLVSQLIAGEKTMLDVAPLRLERF
jgi:D-amino-acid dehydrogenase